jgi:hypothetical protein
VSTLHRLLCFLGFHRWASHNELGKTVVLVLNRCTRSPSCRYAEPFVAGIEQREQLCICRRHAVSPTCPIHGFQSARAVTLRP